MNALSLIVSNFQNELLPDGISKDEWDTTLIFEDGVLHSLDKPAIQFPCGDYIHVVNGLVHYEEGPALIIEHYTLWVLSGNVFEFDTWCSITSKSPKEKAFLQLKFF